MRFDFIRQEKKAFPVTTLCKVMKVSRSGFYRYLKQLDQPEPDNDGDLKAMVGEIFEASKRTYGSRRMSRALRKLGFDVGRYQARNLMRKLGLKVLPTKRFKVTTNSRHSYPVAPNLLDRQFDVETVNRVWGTDITYLWTQEGAPCEQGELYLAVVVDLCSRKVVGWALDKCMTAEFTIRALTMAVWLRRPEHGLLHHSDRGSQYASHEYQQKLEEYGMTCSMSRKGDCWDNAVVERFFRSLKTERTNHCIYQTREAAKRDVIDYIEMFYNCKRLHSYLGYLSPNEYEGLALEQAA